MIGLRPSGPHRGFSMTTVLIFLILLFALWSAVYRTTSSLLRIETNRVLQQTRDQGAMNALAQPSSSSSTARRRIRATPAAPCSPMTSRSRFRTPAADARRRTSRWSTRLGPTWARPAGRCRCRRDRRPCRCRTSATTRNGRESGRRGAVHPAPRNRQGRRDRSRGKNKRTRAGGRNGIWCARRVRFPGA